MKKTIVIILAIVSILNTSAIVFFFVKDNTIVDSSSYISVVVTLLAIIVTIVLGWQIYNVIDYKEKVAEIDLLKKNFEDNIVIENENDVILKKNIVACSKLYSGKVAESLVDFMSAFYTIINRSDFSRNEAIDAIESLNNIVHETLAFQLYLNVKSYKEQHILIINSPHYKDVKQEYDIFYTALLEKINNKEPFIK